MRRLVLACDHSRHAVLFKGGELWHTAGWSIMVLHGGTPGVACLRLFCWLLVALLPEVQASTEKIKMERVECVSRFKGAFTFKHVMTILQTTPGDVLTLKVVASHPSGKPLQYKWLVSWWYKACLQRCGIVTMQAVVLIAQPAHQTLCFVRMMRL